MSSPRSPRVGAPGFVYLLPALAAAAVLLLPEVVLAQNLPQGLDGIADKVRDIQGLVTTVAGVIVAIGAVIVGVKFVKGDPSAWDFAWRFGLGAVLVASAGGVVQWLAG